MANDTVVHIILGRLSVPSSLRPMYSYLKIVLVLQVQNKHTLLYPPRTLMDKEIVIFSSPSGVEDEKHLPQRHTFLESREINVKQSQTVLVLFHYSSTY